MIWGYHYFRKHPNGIIYGNREPKKNMGKVKMTSPGVIFQGNPGGWAVKPTSMVHLRTMVWWKMIGPSKWKRGCWWKYTIHTIPKGWSPRNPRNQCTCVCCRWNGCFCKLFLRIRIIRIIQAIHIIHIIIIIIIIIIMIIIIMIIICHSRHIHTIAAINMVSIM